MSESGELLRFHPAKFAAFLRERGIRRAFLVYDSAKGGIVASHNEIAPLAQLLESDRRDYLAHEGIFFEVAPESATLYGAFVHKTVRGQGAGGVRFWKYDTIEDYLRDGLRLSAGMTRKNALAGLWWGGGKGIVAADPEIDANDPRTRERIYKSYGEFITSLRGCYVTAEDVGTNVADMANVFAKTRFTTCIPPELGGSGNPSVPTARGVVCGMEAAMEFAGAGTLKGKGVAIQGAGNVASALVGFLLEKGIGKLTVCDVNPATVDKLRQRYPDERLSVGLAAKGDMSIVGTPCDIFAPCATGATLNSKTIPALKCRIVCGAANNQLEEPEADDTRMKERGIPYVPDFLVNRMGIVNCADEQYGFVSNDQAFERHLSKTWEHSIHQTTINVLCESAESGLPTGKIAVRMADELAMMPHPLFGHRGKQIIDSLVADRWHVS